MAKDVVTIDLELLNQLKEQKKTLDQKEGELNDLQTQLSRLDTVKANLARVQAEILQLRKSYDELLDSEDFPEELKDMFGGKTVRDLIPNVPGTVNQKLKDKLIQLAAGKKPIKMNSEALNRLADEFGVSKEDAKITRKACYEMVREAGDPDRGSTNKWKLKANIAD